MKQWGVGSGGRGDFLASVENNAKKGKIALFWVSKSAKCELGALVQVRGVLTHRLMPWRGKVDHPILWVHNFSRGHLVAEKYGVFMRQCASTAIPTNYVSVWVPMFVYSCPPLPCAPLLHTSRPKPSSIIRLHCLLAPTEALYIIMRHCWQNMTTSKSKYWSTAGNFWNFHWASATKVALNRSNAWSMLQLCLIDAPMLNFHTLEPTHVPRHHCSPMEWRLVLLQNVPCVRPNRWKHQSSLPPLIPTLGSQNVNRCRWKICQSTINQPSPQILVEIRCMFQSFSQRALQSRC